uniref:Uncharacterized protein n=1 Tax=Glossina brevipalpis TaxID=37001 RepID=A0A1A9X0F2_9MUSC
MLFSLIEENACLRGRIEGLETRGGCFAAVNVFWGGAANRAGAGGNLASDTLKEIAKKVVQKVGPALGVVAKRSSRSTRSRIDWWILRLPSSIISMSSAILFPSSEKPSTFVTTSCTPGSDGGNELLLCCTGVTVRSSDERAMRLLRLEASSSAVCTLKPLWLAVFPCQLSLMSLPGISLPCC